MTLLNKLFSINLARIIWLRMRLDFIYLVYLFRWIPDEDRLLTGDGLEGFFSVVVLS